jgi:hypothetical protein
MSLTGAPPKMIQMVRINFHSSEYPESSTRVWRLLCLFLIDVMRSE